ncbi:MAG: glycosyl transferase [Arcticibacter sp.]
MINFCTLFNSAYLSRGLAMYQSLLRHCDDFHLYIFAFDEGCLQTLRDLKLEHASIISLEEFEDDALLAVKPERTAGEYCWTCTSSTIWYCIHEYGLESCTYIDADLLFFSNPKVLIDEMGTSSVLITEHRYTPRYDQSDLSGIYCVQFITFKRDEWGLAALSWWRNACLEWCFKRFEDGKFGDQKYLDDWTTRFEGVHELNHPGGGVAPWNVQQYSFLKRDKRVMLREIASDNIADVIFYHFHAFKYAQGNVFHLTEDQYDIADDAVQFLYKPYAQAILEAENLITSVSSQAIFHEPLFNLDWVNRVYGRKFSFMLTGRYKNYFRRRKLLSQ